MENNVIPPIIMTVITAACGLVYAFRRRSTGSKAALAAGAGVWGAAQILIFMVPHTIASTLMRVLGKSKPMSLMSTKILGVEYDFRLYALALVGILFIIQAIRMLRAVRDASEGDTEASLRLRYAIWIVLLLAIPLAPISPGIPFLTGPPIVALVMQHVLFAGFRPAALGALPEVAFRSRESIGVVR